MGTQYKDVAAFSEAKTICNSEGGRLYQPRNEDAWNTLLAFESELFADPKGHFPFNTGETYVAIGMEIKIEDGEPVSYYSDGTKVPENLIGKAFVWDNAPTSFPENDAAKTCVGIVAGKLRNVPCAGFANGRWNFFSPNFSPPLQFIDLFRIPPGDADLHVRGQAHRDDPRQGDLPLPLRPQRQHL